MDNGSGENSHVRVHGRERAGRECDGSAKNLKAGPGGILRVRGRERAGRGRDGSAKNLKAGPGDAGARSRSRTREA